MDSIDRAVKDGRLVIGLKSVKKALQQGLLEEVVVSNNGRVFVKELELLLGGVPLRVLSESSRDLGTRCKKPFSIAVLGLRKK